MDDKATAKPTEGEQPPLDDDSSKKQQRGRPAKKNSRDNSHDVLYLKGAAAQQTSHPGNLNYYALCEERFDEWSALDCDDPKRKQICKEIVKTVVQRGGVFRKASGGAMDGKAAIEKTNSRFRQIAKPKLRLHTGMYGENDVVFAKGARNHMYPGNAKWRTLLDGYAQSYHRDMKKLEEQRKSFGAVQPRPEYMNDIVEETISIIEKRGGKFLDEKLTPLSHNVIVDKTHNRFKDMKKEIKAGKLVLNVAKKEPAEDKPSGETTESVAADTSASVKVPTRELVTPGYTSVKVTVSSKKEGKKIIAKNQRRGKKFYGNQHKNADEVELEDVTIPSIPSEESEVDDDDDAADNVDEGKEEEEFKDLSRHERRKRRESGQPAPQPQQKQPNQKAAKKRKRTNQTKKERARSPSPEHPLSEYEQMRLAKMERNRKRLKDLGLA